MSFCLTAEESILGGFCNQIHVVQLPNLLVGRYMVGEQEFKLRLQSTTLDEVVNVMEELHGEVLADLESRFENVGVMKHFNVLHPTYCEPMQGRDVQDAVAVCPPLVPAMQRFARHFGVEQGPLTGEFRGLLKVKENHLHHHPERRTLPVSLVETFHDCCPACPKTIRSFNQHLLPPD